MVEISLIENIQREDLNPIEEAQAYKRLLTEFHLKQDEVAERVSKSRTAVTNSMRLLKLCDPVQKMVVDGMISTGHARALLAIEDPEQQYLIAQKVFDEKLSVREVEKLVKNLNKPPKPAKIENSTLNIIYQDISEKLKQSLGQKYRSRRRKTDPEKLKSNFTITRIWTDCWNRLRDKVYTKERKVTNVKSSDGISGDRRNGYRYLFIAIFILLIAIIVLLIVQIVKYSKLKKKYEKFMKGKDAKSLEQDIIALFEDNKFIKNENEKNRKDIREIMRRMEYCYQKIGLVNTTHFSRWEEN